MQCKAGEEQGVGGPVSPPVHLGDENTLYTELRDTHMCSESAERFDF